MAYSWDNRVKFVVRYLYDVDNNGYLDRHDFECLALRATLMEKRGEYSASRLAENQHIMINLWNEIADLADFNKDGMITTDEFKAAVKQTCIGKTYAEFPQAMKMFIDANFTTIDINASVAKGGGDERTAASVMDGQVTVEEFKQAVQNLCVGKGYQEFPNSMKMFIDSRFKTSDVNGDGVIGAEEFRYDCITRSPFDTVEVLDDAYNKLLNDDDRRRGGLTLARYQELYAQFLGNADENCPAVYLFGPLTELS